MIPFDGAISRYHAEAAPDPVRAALEAGGKRDILTDGYPYDRLMKGDAYAAQMDELQLQLVRLQASVKATGRRVVVVFEGRDAAGKGGTIARVTLNMNPRSARIVALGTPTERERGQWYFQRYIDHLPTAGEIVLFDRSWYNRAVVEPVFGFCSVAERDTFLRQAPEFERMLVDDGIVLVKFWLNVSRAEQLRRLLARESDPLKQWKLSRIDAEGLALWDDYTAAIATMFARTQTDHAPWTVVRSDDKKRARLAAIRHLLGCVAFDGRAVDAPDPAILGGPEIWPRG